MKIVDKTIECVCTWIQAKLEDTDRGDSNHEAAEMVKALADLVCAREGSAF